MLKLYVYGYLHQLTSSRKLEREAGRNIEVMWLTGRLVPDFKTIADFRHDNAVAIQIACQRFVAIRSLCCSRMTLALLETHRSVRPGYSRLSQIKNTRDH